MKMQDKKDLQTKADIELKKMLKEAHESLLTLQLEKAQNKLQNTSSLSAKRNEIAVLKTILKEKEEKK